MLLRYVGKYGWHSVTHIVAAVLALCAAGSASAIDSDAPMFSLAGFGTVGVVHSSEDKADFTSTIYKPTGAGHSRDWSFDVDSRIAAQISAQFTPKTSAVLQVVSEQNYDGSYQPHVEWANIKYQLTPDFSLRAGRSVLPSLLFSETRLVGYSNPWVRPPREVYGLSPITSYDGFDVSYDLQFDDWKNTVRATVGWSDTKLPNGIGTTNVKDLREISNTIESGPLTLHVTYLQSRLNLPSLNQLFNTFRLFGPQGVALADKYDNDHKLYILYGAGASYDPGQWFITGEWAHINTHSWIGKRSGWYVSGGYRFGNITPYLTYGRANADNLSDPGLSAPGTAGLNAALNSLLAGKFVQNTISVGGRWDFMKNADLKLQFDHTDIGTGSSSVLSNIQPGYQTGGKLNLFSVAVDFVF